MANLHHSEWTGMSAVGCGNLMYLRYSWHMVMASGDSLNSLAIRSSMGKIYEKRKFYAGANEERYSPSAVFTKAEIFEILNLYYHQKMNYNRIGIHFKITLVTIKYIIEGPSYSDWVKEWPG